MGNPMIQQMQLVVRYGMRVPGFVCAVLIGLSSLPVGDAADQGAVDEDLRVSLVPASGSFGEKMDPMAAVWERVPEQTIQLNLAPAVHESIVLRHQARHLPEVPTPLHVSVVSDRQRIYFRLRWKDATRDDLRGIGTWPDGVAVQLPTTPEPTSPMMGLPDSPVVIWRWTAAASGVEALLAGGPGTLVGQADPALAGRAVYRGGLEAGRREWVVVIARDLRAQNGAAEPFWTGTGLPVAFALWQGSDAERGGYKQVSSWIQLGMQAVQ